MAALPASSDMVFVGPPLSRSTPSTGSPVTIAVVQFASAGHPPATRLLAIAGPAELVLRISSAPSFQKILLLMGGLLASLYIAPPSVVAEFPVKVTLLRFASLLEKLAIPAPSADALPMKVTFLRVGL